MIKLLKFVMKYKIERGMTNPLSILFLPIFLLFSISSFSQLNESKYFVFFETDSFSLTPIIQTNISNFIQELDKESTLRLYIIGHTDAEGSELYNYSLSEKRANTISKFILNQYPEFKPITRITYEGETNPLANNSSEVGKAQNRRVTIRAIQRKKEKKKYAQINTRSQSEQTNTPKPEGKEFLVEIYDSISNESLSGEISLFTSEGVRISAPQEITSETQNPVFLPEEYSQLSMCVESPSYLYQCVQVFQDSLTDSTFMRIPLGKLQKGMEITLRDLRFYTDQAILKPESIPELNSLVKTMQNNSGMHILIKGHANWPISYGATPNYIYRLSNKRAQAVFAYLINFAINSNRMLYQGVGNEELLYDEPMTPEQVQANKRVNFIILKL